MSYYFFVNVVDYNKQADFQFIIRLPYFHELFYISCLVNQRQTYS